MQKVRSCWERDYMEFKPKITEKVWNQKLEKELAKKWENEKLYAFDKNSDKKVFSIDTPPPYPSGRPWHIGAASHYSQIDMIARTARMTGNEVFFPIGIDRNGLPVEMYAEKKYNIKIHETPREKFVNLCITALDDLEAEMLTIMKDMGLSGDLKNYYRTDSEEYRALTQATFIELWNRGLVYEDTRPNNYCPECGTTIADAEIIYKELPTELVYIKFKIKETGKNLVIATTRPELLCACQVVMVNPKDARYENLKGKHAIVPIYNKEVPIIAHPYVDMEFGSGVVMICSYGDYGDVRIFRELNLKEVIAIDKDGKMTEAAGKYAGLKISEAKKKIIEDMEKENLVEKKENIRHRTPMCDRSKTPIEIIPMKEFYLKQMDYKKEIKDIAKKLKFHPECHRQILLDWIDSVTIDWPISRRRVYGTEIPIWYCKKCKKPNLPKPGKYYKPWKDDPPFRKCQHCNSDNGFIGEWRTFDTWMDSSISPLFISKYKKDDELFKKIFPITIRPQAKDIIRTWLFYTLLRCYQLTGRSAFEHVWVMGYGVDETGEKMSKSKGNVIDPLPILKKYGADCFRLWSASESSLGSDFRCSEEKIKSNGKFLTKLWNVSRFISMFPQPAEPKLTATDEWILSELNELIKKCLSGYGEFNFFTPATEIRNFVSNLFAPHYMEMVKQRCYGIGFGKEEREAAWHTLHLVLKTLLKLSAPIIPFITDYIYRELYGACVHKQRMPNITKEYKLQKLTKEIENFNMKIWKMKKDRKLSLKSEIKIGIPKELKRFEKDLIAMHNIK